MILLHMVAQRDTWSKVDREVEMIEDKGQLYPLSVLRRVVGKYFKPAEKNGLSLTIKIAPLRKISVLEFQGLIQEVLQDASIDARQFYLKSDTGSKYSFEVITHYDAYENRFVEVHEEAQEDLDEEVSLENETKCVSIELIPKNEAHVANNLEELFYLVVKAFNGIVMNVSKKMPYEATFALELRFKKGKLEKTKKMAEELKDIDKLKVYVRDDVDFDRVVMIMPFEEINDPKKIQEIMKKVK